MNKRQAKKVKNREFIKLLTTIGNNDILVFQYNFGKIKQSELLEYYTQLNNRLSNEIIFIPSNIELIKFTDKIEAVEYLNKCIDEIMEG